MHLKKLATIGAAALLVTALAGCSPAATTSPAQTTAAGAGSAPGPAALKNAEGVTDITFWHGFGGINAQALQNLVDQFNTENAGKINVTLSGQGNYANLLAKYTASLQDDSEPTVILPNDISTGFMSDVGKSVSPVAMAAANPGTLNLDDIAPAGKRYFSKDGELMAVPMAMSTPLLFVNKDLLQKAGVDTGSLTTLSGVAEAATKIKDVTGIPGIAEAFDNWWVEQLTATSGETLCAPDNGRGSKDATKVTLTQPGQLKAFSTMADLFASGAALNIGTNNNDAVTAFAAGKTAMMFNSSAVSASVSQSVGFPYEALAFPLSAPKTKAGPAIGGSALWLSSTATDAQQVAGWQLITFLASATSQAAFSEATGYVPTNTKVPNTVARAQYLTSNPGASVAIKQVESSPDVPATAGCLSGAMTSIRAAILPNWQNAFTGSVSVKDGFTAAQDDANKALSQYRQQKAAG